MDILEYSSNGMFLTINSHFEHAGKLAKEARKLFFGDVSCAFGVQCSPCLFEAANFLSTDLSQSAGMLIDVTEALIDERDEQTGEDVHAQDVPEDE